MRSAGSDLAGLSYPTASADAPPVPHRGSSSEVDEGSTSPAAASHVERESNDDLLFGDEPMYDPFDRPDGEVVLEAIPLPRSCSPSRSRSV